MIISFPDYACVTIPKRILVPDQRSIWYSWITLLKIELFSLLCDFSRAPSFATTNINPVNNPVVDSKVTPSYRNQQRDTGEYNSHRNGHDQ